MTKRATFEMSVDARLLLQEFKKANVGDIVDFKALSVAIGRPVRNVPGALQTALRVALREDNLNFGNVRGVGYKRLSDIEIVNQGEHAIVGTRRRAKRIARKLSAVVDYAAMPPSAQLRHSALMSVNAMIADVTREHAIKRVEKAVTGSAALLPIRDTLKALGF